MIEPPQAAGHEGRSDGAAAERTASPKDQRAMVAMDLGAESCRVSLLRWLAGSPHIELVHRHANAPVDHHGELRWDLKQITAGLDEGLRKCAQIASEGIRSIGADGWAVDYVRLGADGTPIADPFCYRDQRTVQAEAEIHKRISPERLRSIAGTQMLRINTLYQLYADGPGLQDSPWLNLPEYILHRMGGSAVAEYTNATHTQLIDAERRQWSAEIFEAAGLPLAAAPRLVQAGTIVGQLNGAMATLPTLRETMLIAPACHDTASAIAGIPDSGSDWAYISSGTWSLVGTVLHQPVNEGEARTADFTNLGAAGGRICFHKNVNGMWLLRQCMTEWARDIDWNVPELVHAAEQQDAPNILLDVDEADLLLPGKMPARINAQLQRRGVAPMQVGAEAAPQMVALILHSLAARYGETIRSLTRVTGKRFQKIYIVGGASRNAFLNRLTAAATGLEVKCGPVESSTIGNFAVQLAAMEGRPGAEAPPAEEVGRWAHTLQGAAG